MSAKGQRDDAGTEIGDG
ncbi:hypothetical protein CGLO_15651 [Colletotrichum gloeosporioides Cg-14]|uniref:Uncharacterized protein n=1 Tax=Colletotrichum gloeosporioides (strain Cg-14) TaxID=1237896 RepID=T0L1P5_COLGC|nr:hypothetical protein CGLO_15651 [Colletotrichum gloeosporioides Cg-14]